jgi:serine/threonine-protein kinase
METITDRFVGTKIGRYRIEALLGRGRGAAVYRAIDPVVDRQVAIKLLDAGTARDRQLVDAFLSDTRILAALRHPHILPIYEVAEQEGIAYFVRQLTDGGTLHSRLSEGKQLSVGEAAAILRPVATALDYAHRQGIVHRNLRPTNILLTAGGHVFVTDFTLPGKEHQTSAATTVVNANNAPAYVSPEQARGGAIDGRSDVYVLAVILYETLTGRPPFRIESPTESARTVITRHLQEEPPSPRAANPSIGSNVEAVLLRGLEKEPEKRFPSAAALFYALSEADELDRSGRRQGEGGPTAPGEGRRAARELAPQQSVPTVFSAAPASSAAELDDLLATLSDFDSVAAENVAPPAPATHAPLAPATAEKTTPANKVAESAPTRNAPATATPAAAAAKRSPFLAIGGVAALILIAAIAAFMLTRGGQPTQAEATQGVPSASVAAAVASSDPAPTAAIPPTQPAASVAAAVPSPVATTTVAPSAAGAAPTVAAPVASQRPAPVRREAIVYAETRSEGNTASLVAISPDGTDRQQLIDLPGHAWGPHIAVDGRSIVFSVGSGASSDQTFVGGLSGRGQHDLYLANLDGSAPTRLTTTTAWNAGWSWSPDGTTLAFTSNRDGNWEIYLLTLPGREVKRLTTNAGQDAWPNWTADGKALIFMSARDGYPQLYRMNADGGNVARLITSEASDSYPVISPDGQRIAYISQGIGSSESDIFVASLDGSNATRLTSTGDNGQPAWSPDSARIAFASSRDGNYNIFAVRTDGTGLTRLTDAPGDEVTPSWGTIELPAGSSGSAPLAHLPLGGAVALAFGPSISRRER